MPQKSFFIKKISTKAFILSQLVLLILGLTFIFFIYYKINIEYQIERTQTFGKGPVTTAPKSLTLETSSPEDNTLTFQASLIVAGSTSPNIPVLITNGEQSVVIESQLDGSFSTVINLSEGVNQIKIAVFSSLGDQRTQEKIVYYSKEKI